MLWAHTNVCLGPIHSAMNAGLKDALSALGPCYMSHTDVE